jgi:hypothetical protein
MRFRGIMSILEGGRCRPFGRWDIISVSGGDIGGFMIWRIF